MVGGKFSWPWKPYELYATIDYIYGWPAYDQHNGFTAAQSTLNVIETAAYMYYLYILYRYGQPDATEGRGATSSMGWLGRSRKVNGTRGASAAMILFGTSLMTVSKTVLYWLNEAFSGFSNIGHNHYASLFVYWVIPK